MNATVGRLFLSRTAGCRTPHEKRQILIGADHLLTITDINEADGVRLRIDISSGAAGTVTIRAGGDSLHVAGIDVRVSRIEGGWASISFTGSREIRVLRGELCEPHDLAPFSSAEAAEAA